ncbi:hypothetical protein JCM5296_003901, partial [Sporobolomyces johnsonii]
MPKSRSTRARTSTAAPYNSSSPQSSPTRTSTAAALAADLAVRETTQLIAKAARQARPATTLRAYDNKQQEFKAWCDSRGFSDGHAVRGDKLAVFLHDEVVYRAPRKRGRKADPNSVRSRAKAKKAAPPPTDPEESDSEDGEGDGGSVAGGADAHEGAAATPRVSPAVVEQYKAAIIDLYQQQVSLRINSHPHPNSFPELGKLIKQVKSETHKIKRSKYVDRGIAEALRDRLGFTLAHYALLRSNNVLPIELADLFPVELPNEGPSPCFATVVLVNNGKTNQNGRVEYGAFIRNSDPEICGVGALALYLFLRFHVSQETF